MGISPLVSVSICTDKRPNPRPKKGGKKEKRAMGTAAASIRTLLPAFPMIHLKPTRNSTSRLSLPSPNPLVSKTLNPKKSTTLKPSSPPIFSSSSSFYAYNDTEANDEFNYKQEEEEEMEEERSRAVTSRPREAGRLYVGNLPYSISSAQLAEIFNQAGTVECVEMVCDRVTDRSRGFAFVTMASSVDASNAIRMFDGSQVGGRTVKVNFPEVPRGGEREMMGPQTRAHSRGYVDSPFKVYAGNLGWTVTSESLKDAFFGQPGLLGAKVIYEHDSGRSRGFGFVSFASAEDAQSAVDTMNGKEAGGRPLRLNLASEKSSTPAAAL